LTQKSINKLIKHTSIFLMLCLLVLPVISVAQQYYDPGLIQKTIDRTPAEYKPTGVRVGAFMLHPGVELTWVNNDNIYYLNDGGPSDNIWHIRPWANLLSDWSRHSLNLRFYADIARFSDFETEDYEDWRVSIDGRFDVRRNSAFSYRLAYMNLHEDRSSPDDVNGVVPTVFTYYGYDIGYGHTFNHLTAKLNYNRFYTNYDDNYKLDGEVINNQDRDRTRDELRLDLSYGLPSGKTALLFGVAGNNTDYDQPVDDNGYRRSSSGYRYNAGVGFTITSLLIGDLFVTYSDQDYDDSRLNNVSGWGLGAALNWTPTETTNVNIRAETAPQETIQEGSSGYLSNLYAVRIQQELRRNLMGNLRFSYTDNKYETNGNDDTSLSKSQVYRTEIGLSYLINAHFYISGGYSYTQQKANLPNFEYTTKRWFVTFTAEL